MLSKVKDIDTNFHFAVIDDGQLETYIYDALKKVTKGNKDTIFYIRKKMDIEEMVDLSYVLPYGAEKWLFIIDFDKVKAHRRTLIKFFKSKPVTLKVFTKFSKYADYVSFQKELGLTGNFMYLKTLRRDDMVELFREYRLHKSLFDFVYHSYRGEVGKVMQLRQYLELGGIITSRKDISDQVGVSAGSVQHFVMGLLNTKVKNAKSLRVLAKNRNVVLLELSKVYSTRALRTMLLGIVKDILDIKTLYLSGVVYKSLRDIPEGYDEKRLSRYKFLYSRILEIPYSTILELYLYMLRNDKPWDSPLDLYLFIYGYIDLKYQSYLESEVA